MGERLLLIPAKPARSTISVVSRAQVSLSFHSQTLGVSLKSHLLDQKINSPMKKHAQNLADWCKCEENAESKPAHLVALKPADSLPAREPAHYSSARAWHYPPAPPLCSKGTRGGTKKWSHSSHNNPSFL